MATKNKKRRYLSVGSNDGTSPEKTKATIMTSLECPVCLEVPRVGTGLAIYGCRNGHLLCQGCVGKIQECPICREKEINCRNLFAERYIEAEFKDVPLKCKYLGCGVQLPMTDLTQHEKFCPHREAPCPSSHRHTCNWRGPLTNLIRHMKDKKCVQVIFDDNSKKVSDGSDSEINFLKFKSNLGDFPSPAVSVFERSNVITHWKPVVLLAKSILNIWCYVLVQRDSHGLWNFMTYSMLPKDSLDHIKAKITVGNITDTRKFTFETKILSFETSKDEAVKMGQYMCLQDSQIKPFKQGMENKNALFHYSVEIQADPEFLIEMNRRAYVKKAVPNPIATATEDNIQEANNERMETINEALYCEKCSLQFDKKTVYDIHLSSVHKMNIEVKSEEKTVEIKKEEDGKKRSTRNPNTETSQSTE